MVHVLCSTTFPAIYPRSDAIAYAKSYEAPQNLDGREQEAQCLLVHRTERYQQGIEDGQIRRRLDDSLVILFEPYQAERGKDLQYQPRLGGRWRLKECQRWV